MILSKLTAYCKSFLTSFFLGKLFFSLCLLIYGNNLMMAEIANYLMSCLKADYIITNCYPIWYMIYKRIKGSRQIGNYLAGHVPPNRKLFGRTVPPNSLPPFRFAVKFFYLANNFAFYGKSAPFSFLDEIIFTV